MSPKDIVELWLYHAIVNYIVVTYEKRAPSVMFPRAIGEVRNVVRGSRLLSLEKGIFPYMEEEMD